MKNEILRIKSDVDLKELEKFSFQYDTRTKFYFKSHKSKAIEWYDVDEIMISKDTRTILVLEESGLCVLFDLIQAGLVEKVEK